MCGYLLAFNNFITFALAENRIQIPVKTYTQIPAGKYFGNIFDPNPGGGTWGFDPGGVKSGFTPFDPDPGMTLASS